MLPDEMLPEGAGARHVFCLVGKQLLVHFDEFVIDGTMCFIFSMSQVLIFSFNNNERNDRNDSVGKCRPITWVRNRKDSSDIWKVRV